MTEQEFRELTAYQPPTPPKSHNSPAVSSIAAAVAAAGSKAPANEAAAVQEVSAPVEPQAQVADIPALAPVEPPPQSPPAQQSPPPLQAYTQTVVTAPPPPPPPVPAPIPEPARAETPPRPPAQPKQSVELVPQQKHDELMEQYSRLSDRFKRIVEERDNLSRQVVELKRAISERAKNEPEGSVNGRDFKEEIRLLGKLIDDEQTLRRVAVESGAFRPGEDPYARHDKLVNVFLNIVAHSD